MGKIKWFNSSKKQSDRDDLMAKQKQQDYEIVRKKKARLEKEEQKRIDYQSGLEEIAKEAALKEKFKAVIRVLKAKEQEIADIKDQIEQTSSEASKKELREYLRKKIDAFDNKYRGIRSEMRRIGPGWEENYVFDFDNPMDFNTAFLYFKYYPEHYMGGRQKTKRRIKKRSSLKRGGRRY